MKRTRWMAIALALAACQCESAPKAPPNPAAPISQAARVRMHMSEHFEAMIALQTAVAHGRLADAREQASWLASHSMAEPAEWKPYIEAMRFSARKIAFARDVPTAGAGLGELGRACASCHLAFDAMPAFSYGSAPGDERTLDAQMRRHQWAAMRLWEGVFGPSNQQWFDGASVMANSRLELAATVHDKPNAEVIALGERLREQAQRAQTISDRDERARFYGEMMTTCAGCHTIVRPHPVAAALPEQ